MQITHEKNFFVFTTYSSEEYDELKTWCRQNFGRSHSIFVSPWFALNKHTILVTKHKSWEKQVIELMFIWG